MKTDDLIGQLVEDASPVRRVRPPSLNVMRWTGAALLSVGVGVAALGLKQDWTDSLTAPASLLSLLLPLALGVASAFSAFVLTVPGLTKRSFWIIPCLTLLSWLGVLLYALLSGSERSGPGHGFSCIQSTVLFGVLPGFLLFALLNQGAPLRVRLVGTLAVLASAAFGAFGSQLTCINDEPSHLLVWHALPVVGLSLAGIWLGRWMLKKSWL